MSQSRLIALAIPVAAALLIPLTAIAPAEGAAPAPIPPQNALISVSCPRPNACMAVGYRDGGSQGALAERWNGKRWRVVSTPTLTGPGGQSELVAVSCQTASLCLALGWSRSRTNVFNGIGVVEKWNGIRWRVLDVRFPKAWFVQGMSCVRRACMIVGSIQNPRAGQLLPLAALLTGTRLRQLRPAVPRGSNVEALGAVSCTAASFCAAVGSYEIQGVGTLINLAETWNGTTWRIRRTWHPVRFATVLDAVSCASPELCMAGGAPVAGFSPGMTIDLLWKNGRWRALEAERQLAGSPDVPTGFSCSTASRCVGSEYGLNSSRSAALTWNGGRTLGVHLVPQPPIGGLFAISCPRPARCIAVGGFATGAGAHDGVYSELWNGRKWFLLR